MTYLGDYLLGATVDFKWSSNNADGASITRSTDGTISVYKSNDTTQRTAEIADTEDFDGLTGIHHCSINTNNSFYVANTDYQVVLSAATINSQTVNAVIGQFSIQKRSSSLDTTSLANLITAATNYSTTRGLAGTALPNAAADAAGGLPISDAGGLDLDAMNTNINDIETDTADIQPKIGTITDLGGGSTLGSNLSDIAGATFNTTTDSNEAIRNKQTDIETDTQDIQGRLPAALVGGLMSSDITAISTDTTAADNLESDYDGTGYNKSNSTIGTLTTYTGNTPQTGDVFTQIGFAGVGLTHLAESSICTETRLSELDSGNLPSDIDNILIDTGTTLDGKLNTAQADLDTITGTGGVIIGTDVMDRSTTLDVNTKTISNDAITASTIAADSIGASELATDAVNEIVDQVWNEAQADHVSAGSMGLIASEIADILVDTAEIGTAGDGLTNINLPDQTMNITGNITGNLTGSVGDVISIGFAGVGLTHLAESSICTETRLTELDSANMPTDIDNILVDTNSLNDTKIPDTISLANINAEVDTALITTTYGEPSQGAPSATASIKDKLSYMYKFARNKIENDGINIKVYADDGSTIDHLSPVSSVGGTVTRGEFISGA